MGSPESQSQSAPALFEAAPSPRYTLRIYTGNPGRPRVLRSCDVAHLEEIAAEARRTGLRAELFQTGYPPGRR